MCGIIIAFVVLAGLVSAILHVSAGWGIGIVAAALVVAAVWQAKNGTTQRVSKTGLVYSNVCPACRKHNKGRATKCRHCGTPLVVAREPAPAVTQPEPVAVRASATDDRSMKTCPDCAESVLAAARKCRYCGYTFE